jgi:pimeloyl-ACP methyl ester carboxylesterase
MHMLVLLPGLLCDKALWSYQEEVLAKKCPIMIPDLSQQDSIQVLAENLLQKLPEKFFLCGFSMGGYVAFEILRLAKNRVIQLALINTTHRLDSPEMRKRRLDFIALAEKGRFRGVTPQLLPMLLDEHNVHNHIIRETIFDMAKRIGREGFINQEKAILGRIDHTSLLGEIDMPTLIIGGQKDLITPPEHQTEMHRLIKGSSLHLLENVGHISPLEAPKKVSDLLDHWLRC